MRAIGIIVSAVLGVVLIFALLFGLGVLNLEKRKFFEPRNAEIDRKVFEQTPSYIQGKNQHLTRLMSQYKLADTNAKKETLKQMILHEASTIDSANLTPTLNQFINNLK